MTGKEFFDFAKKNGAEMMDLKFCDMLGTWQFCSDPIAAIDESILTDGLGFDSSSIRGWQKTHQSDMLAVCAPETESLTKVRYEQNQRTGYYQIDSVEGSRNTSRGGIPLYY